jgi:hypothetical protein
MVGLFDLVQDELALLGDAQDVAVAAVIDLDRALPGEEQV